MNGLLLLMIFFPLGVAALMLLLRAAPTSGGMARWLALLGSAGTLLLSLVLTANFNQLPLLSNLTGRVVQPRLEIRQTWLSFGADNHLRLEYYFGVDGISLLLLLLTTLLTLVAVLYGWNRPRERTAEYFASILALETGLLGAFCSFDLLLFYVFFEFTLIPLFFLIGLWGGPESRQAARRFFIYTLTGSLGTLVGLVALGISAASRSAELVTPFSIPDLSAALAANPLPYSLQVGLFLAISLGFAIKVPLIPFHTWQPLTYTEAPTAGSVLLSGIVMKLGTYGFLRICLPLLPAAVLNVGVPLVGTLAVIGIVYGALAALVQRDLKRLIAYSSISHIGFCMLGLFALNNEGISGGVLQMINHGLSTSALFLMIGMIFDRYKTRQLTRLGGLAQRLPWLAVCMIFACFASMGLPGLNGFVSEFLALSGMYARSPVYTIVGAAGVVLGAWYLLSMLQNGFFGPLREPEGAQAVADLRPLEGLLLSPLMILCLVLGVYPQPMLNLIAPDVQRIAGLYEPGRALSEVVRSEPASAKVAIIGGNSSHDSQSGQ